MASAAKRRCLEAANDSSNSNNEAKHDVPADPLTGHIRFKVDKLSDAPKPSKYSAEVQVGGMPWRLHVRKENGAEENCLGVYLFSWKNGSKLWSAVVSFVFTILNTDRSKNIIEKFSPHTFNCDSTSWGRSKILPWEQLIDQSKGFIKNDTIEVEVRFTISKMTGIRMEPTIDHKDASEPMNDVTFLINGEKILANKGFLCVHSPVFNIMFNRNYVEKKMKVIPLEDLEAEEFLTMLSVLYPSQNKVSDLNVRAILKVADRFQIKLLIDQSEDYLLSSSNLELESKLLLSEKYRLVKLQGDCISKYVYKKDIERLKNSPDYKELSDAMKVLLLEKVFVS